MKKLLVVMNIYNEIELVERSIKSVAQNTKGEFDFVLVYNHPPDMKLRKLKALIKEYKITVLDPGRNLGCHEGFNYGVKQTNPDWQQGKWEYEYIAKIDDDTIVPLGWDEPMIRVFDLDYHLAYISAVNLGARQGRNFKKRTLRDYLGDRQIVKHHIEIPREGVVGFSCVVFPVKTLDRVGLLSTENVFRANRRKCGEDNLFMGEEQNYSSRVRRKGRYGAYLTDVDVVHIDNGERKDTDYLVWKFWYGYLGRTTEDYPTFRKNKLQLSEAYRGLLGHSEWWQKIAIRRLTELKCHDALPMIEAIKTEDPATIKLIEEAKKKLKGK